MKNIVFAMMAMMLAPAFAMAGESNSKDDPLLRLRNRSEFTALAVIGDFTAEMAAAESLEDFEEAGGIVLGPGQRSDGVEVKAGEHQVSWFFIIDDELPEDEFDFETQGVEVREGRDRTFTLPNPFAT